jgi:hypothetical protein
MLKISPGFDYNFNALSIDPEKNELMKSFSAIFKAGQKISATVMPILKAKYPALRFLVRNRYYRYYKFILSTNLHWITTVTAGTKRRCKSQG